MYDDQPPRGNSSRKALSALDGDDEFSVFSVSPLARKPPVELKDEPMGRPEDTAVSNSVVRFFRKIFGD